MARITPTIDSTVYNGVHGDERKLVVRGTIAGDYTAATAGDGGVLLTAAQLGLRSITYASVERLFTADTIEEYPVALGPDSSSTGIVIALVDKDDNLQSGDGAVTGVTFQAQVYGIR